MQSRADSPPATGRKHSSNNCRVQQLAAKRQFPHAPINPAAPTDRRHRSFSTLQINPQLEMMTHKTAPALRLTTRRQPRGPLGLSTLPAGTLQSLTPSLNQITFGSRDATTPDARSTMSYSSCSFSLPVSPPPLHFGRLCSQFPVRASEDYDNPFLLIYASGGFLAKYLYRYSRRQAIRIYPRYKRIYSTLVHQNPYGTV